MRKKNTLSAIKKERAGGLTFVEVVVALAMVSIALTALMSLHIRSVGMIGIAKSTSHAISLAEDKIAETLARGYPHVGIETGITEKDNLSFNWRTEVADLQLSQLDQTDISGLRKILVDVSWKKEMGRKQIQMLTYVANRKLNEQ